MPGFRETLKKIFGQKSNIPTEQQTKLWGRQLVDESWKETPDVEKMKKLILKGADVNVTTADNASVLLAIAGRPNFSDAAAEDLSRQLVAAGADVNIQTESGNTALIWALRKRRTKLALFLVKQGADPYATNSKDECGYSLAETFGDKEVLKAMQAPGPKPARPAC